MATQSIKKISKQLVNGRLTVEYGISVTNHSYFSITAHLKEWINGQLCESFGCLHEDILQHFPDMKDLVDIHLSDAETGMPMYAKENGFYHLCQKGIDYASEYLHLNEANSQELKRVMLEAKTGTLKETFNAFVDSMADTWKMEADAIKAKYQL